MIEPSGAVMLGSSLEPKKLSDMIWRGAQSSKAWASCRSCEQTLLVDIPNPTAGPSKPHKNGYSNSPCNKSGFLIVQEGPLHGIYWEGYGAAEL